MTAPDTKNQLRRLNRARKFPVNTCPASRMVENMALNILADGEDWLIKGEPETAVEAMLAVVESLWKARTQLEKLKGKK